MKTLRILIDLLSETLSGDSRDMNASFSLAPENGVAPIDIAKFALACEHEFRLTLYDEKIANWKTLGDARMHIDELLEEGQAENTNRTQEDRTAWFYE